MSVGVRQFVSQLRSPVQDVLVNLMTNMMVSASPERLQHLTSQLDHVKASIERQNRRREYLMADLSGLDSIMDEIERVPDPDLSLKLMHALLSDLRLDLRGQIDRMKPEAELKRKHELKVQLDKLVELKQVAGELLELTKTEGASGSA